VVKRTIAEELTRAIRSVAQGGVYLDPTVASTIASGFATSAISPKGAVQLSPREQEVLVDVARGYSNKEIGERLHISVKTVEGHKASLMEKLNLKSRADIVRFALRQSWLQDE
jgi:DNA-binding NarL/FixJ family response regulator